MPKRAEDELVTIATLGQPWEAELALHRLEQGGVRAVLADDGLVSMGWLGSDLVGGVKVQVMAQDAELARRLLADAGENEA